MTGLDTTEPGAAAADSRRGVSIIFEPAPPATAEPPRLLSFPSVFVIVLAVLSLRNPDAFLRPAILFDDGVGFFRQQEVYGFGGALVRLYGGYVQLLPRLVAALASLFPVEEAARIYDLAALVNAAVCCAWLSRPAYAAILPDARARAALCVALAALPTGPHMITAITFAQYYLTWLGFLLAMAPLPATRAGRAAFVGAWVLIAFSAPGALALLPVLALRLRHAPGRDRAALLAAMAPALVSLAIVVAGADPAAAREREQGLIFTDPRTAGEMSRLDWMAGIVKIVIRAVSADVVLGEVYRLGLDKTPAKAIVAAGAAAFAISVATLARRGTPRQRVWLLLGGLTIALLLAITVGARPDIVRASAKLEGRWGGGRYFWVPVAFVVLVEVAAVGRLDGWRKLLIAPALAAMLASAVLHFPVPRILDRDYDRSAFDWPRDVAEYARARREGRTGTVQVRAAPPGWDFPIRLERGAPVPE